MKKPGLKLLAAAACVLSGCASYIQGVSQVITFDIDPPEAVCAVNIENSARESVSGKHYQLEVLKGRDDIVLNCIAYGYESKVFKVSQSIAPLGLLSIPLDLGMTDLMTGAMFQYPKQVSMVLRKETAK